MLLTELLTLLSNKTRMFVQCGVFLILNVLDAHSTWLVLKPNHYHRERNPIARWVFRKLRIPKAIVIFKSLILIPLGIFIAYWRKEALTINIALLIGNLLFIYVIIHNYRVSRHYKKQYESFRSQFEAVNP